MSRRGKNTAPRRLRKTARNSANARMTTSQIMKNSMLRTNLRATSGKLSTNSFPLKNACFTAGQFGECRMANAITPKTTTVLTSARATPFAPSCRKRSRNRWDRRAAWKSSGGAGASGGVATSLRVREDRHLADVRLLGKPQVRDGLEPSGCLQRRESLVHAVPKPIALHERQPEVFGIRLRRELPHHHAVLHLLHVGIGDVQPRGKVHDDAVDGTGVERRHRVRQALVAARLLRGLDDVRDDLVARGTQRCCVR